MANRKPFVSYTTMHEPGASEALIYEHVMTFSRLSLHCQAWCLSSSSLQYSKSSLWVQVSVICCPINWFVALLNKPDICICTFGSVAVIQFPGNIDKTRRTSSSWNDHWSLWCLHTGPQATWTLDLYNLPYYLLCHCRLWMCPFHLCCAKIAA